MISSAWLPLHQSRFSTSQRSSDNQNWQWHWGCWGKDLVPHATVEKRQVPRPRVTIHKNVLKKAKCFYPMRYVVKMLLLKRAEAGMDLSHCIRHLTNLPFLLLAMRTVLRDLKVELPEHKLRKNNAHRTSSFSICPAVLQAERRYRRTG